jgi:hypothetical protein
MGAALGGRGRVRGCAVVHICELCVPNARLLIGCETVNRRVWLDEIVWPNSITTHPLPGAPPLSGLRLKRR